jgi:hypothetical protein
VRCGRCLHVFDGFVALAGEQGGIAALEHPDRIAEQRTRAVEPTGRAADQPDRAAALNRVVPEQPRAAPQAERVDSAAARGLREAPPGAAIAEEPSASQTGARMRIAACVLLAGLLAVQLAYLFRSQLAARSPAVRAMFSSVCSVFACTVPLPQRPDLLKIEASDVHMLDASRPGLIQLTTTLRSYADFDVAYPALDLVLTNATEHALARRIFVPREYLGGTRDANAGLPARAEITVALDLDTGNLNAAGFRVDLLAAPVH